MSAIKLSNISNVIRYKREGSIFENIFCDVDVTTGRLWRKKTQKRTVFKECPLTYWIFIDTGEYTPDRKMEQLWRAYEAKELLRKAQLHKIIKDYL